MKQCILDFVDFAEPIFAAVFCVKSERPGVLASNYFSSFFCFCLSKGIQFSKCSYIIFCFILNEVWQQKLKNDDVCRFSGEEDNFTYWSEKFEGYMHGKKLRQKLLGDEASDDNDKYNIWAELEQCLDKRSKMMLKSECKGNGPEAWTRLQAHFSSSETPRVMNLLEQLTSLSLKPSGEMTDYLIRAETLSSPLEVAGEKISEKL